MATSGLIVGLRTEQPEAQLVLFDASGQTLEHFSWTAHRELADTLLGQIRDLLARHHATFDDLQGVVVFQGPGSFTGLRIGITVANSLAYGQQIAIVGTQGDNWAMQGFDRLQAGDNDKIVMPEYGREANITTPRK